MKTPDPKTKAVKETLDEPLKESRDTVAEDAKSDATREEIDQLRRKGGDYDENEKLPLKEQE